MEKTVKEPPKAGSPQLVIFSADSGAVGKKIVLTGKSISIERQIEKTKDRYYDVLETSDIGWHEGKNDPTPFIRYMLTVILACYTRFEDYVKADRPWNAKAYYYEYTIDR